jgi:hypothetical protein
MALVVEDGTGKSNADSYVSLVEAETYFTNLNILAWLDNDDDTAKEGALREATKYLDRSYNFIGSIFSTSQSLNWPRESVYDSQGREFDEVVPQAVKDATCELALNALSGRLVSNVSNSNYVTREKVGDIEVEYAEGAPTNVEYTYVDSILNDFLLSNNNSAFVPLNRV